MTLSDADLALLGAYVDGTIDDEQVVFRFEERLANEPELADALDESGRADLFARTLRAPKAHVVAPPSARSRPRLLGNWRFQAVLAAAAGVLALFYFVPSRPSVNVTVIACGVTLEKNHGELGLTGEDAIKVPKGTLRGSDTASTRLVEIPVEEYLAIAEPLQERRVLEALEGTYKLVDAEYFVVAVRTIEPCSAVVLLIEAGGRVVDSKGNVGQIAWPADGEWNPESGRLETPGDHVLPRRNVLRGDEKIYDPGFLVPIGAKQIGALIGLRPEPLAADLRQALQAAVESVAGLGAEESQGQLIRWLEERGFEVQTRVVPERRQDGG